MGERSHGSIRRVALRVSVREAGWTLAEVLADALAATGVEASRARVRAMIAAGVVHVDGRPLRVAARPLRVGQRVDALAQLEALRPPTRATDLAGPLDRRAILYRDRWLLAVAKPPGLPTHATADPGRASLVGEIERLLAGEGAAPAIAVHHRLDRDTSGVVLFGLDPAANAGLARAFARREAEKTYLALTARPDPLPPGSLRVDAPIAAGGPASRPVRVGGNDAKTARTDVTRREVLPQALLVEVRPHSGRKHQVRVHLAHVGLPILGDPLYGRPGAAPRLMLHATRLALVHPVTGRPLVIDCPVSPDFAALLERLRARPRR
jgi:23S rRNA pseudouridine1911/1915/1917 synthase